MVNNLTVLYIPVTSTRPSACFNTAVSTEEAGVRVLALGGETDVFVVALVECDRSIIFLPTLLLLPPSLKHLSP